MEEFGGSRGGRVLEKVLFEEVLIVFGVGVSLGVVGGRKVGGVVEEIVKVFGDGVGDEAVEVMFFLFGGGVEGGSESIFLGGEVLLDHEWMFI